MHTYRLRTIPRGVQGLAVVATVVLLLGGCGGGGSGGSGSAGSDSSRTLHLGDKFEKGGASVQVFGFASFKPSTVFPGEEDRQFASIDAQLCAGKKPIVLYDQSFFKLVMADNTEAEHALGNTKEPELLKDGATVSPGDCSRGFVSFQFSPGAKPAAVVFGFLGPSVRWILP